MALNRSALCLAAALLLVARTSSAYLCNPGGGAVNVAPTGTATASSNPASAGNAFDLGSTAWTAAPGTTSAVLTWVAPADVVVGQVAFGIGATPTPLTYGSVFVELLDASDIVLASGSPVVVHSTIFGVSAYTPTFHVPNLTLRKVRLTVGSTGSPPTLSLNHITIMAVSPPIAPPLPGPGPEELSVGATFQGLGDGPGGAFLSRANAVSPDGRLVVGETETAPGLLRGFRFADGTFTTLGTGGSIYTFLGPTQQHACVTPTQSRVFAASNTGHGVGSVCLGGACGATRFGGGAPEVYETGVSSHTAIASDITADGAMITGRYTVSGPSIPQGSRDYFYRLVIPQYTVLGSSLGGTLLLPPRISPDGECVVATIQGQGSGGVGSCGAFPNETATDVSAGGTHVVGSSGGLAARGSEVLGDLPGGAASSRALGVSDDGNTIVGWGNTASGQEAFVWTPADGIQRLADVLASQGVDLTGWTLVQATGVSASGRTIVGWGTNPSAQTEGFLATLQEPAPQVPALGGRAWVLAALVSATGLLAVRRHSRSETGSLQSAPTATQTELPAVPRRIRS